MSDTDKMREAFENLCKECGPTISFYDFEMGWDAALAELAAELERLRKDAERYHYIRKMGLREAGFKENKILFAAQDEAIDAAIAAEGEK